MEGALVTTTKSQHKCKCGSNKWIFRGLSEWDNSPIKESTYIHVTCVACGAQHGLLDNEPSWTFE